MVNEPSVFEPLKFYCISIMFAKHDQQVKLICILKFTNASHAQLDSLAYEPATRRLLSNLSTVLNEIKSEQTSTWRILHLKMRWIANYLPSNLSKYIDGFPVKIFSSGFLGM